MKSHASNLPNMEMLEPIDEIELFEWTYDDPGVIGRTLLSIFCLNGVTFCDDVESVT